MIKRLATILIPVYNGEKYLNDMLESVFRQTYRPLQVIVSNDCSSDKSKEICIAWENKHNADAEISILYLENVHNLGLSKNILKMVEYIQGEYIFLSDQDDVWKSNKVERQVEYLYNHVECMICLCDRSITNSNLQIVIDSEYSYKGYNKKSMKMDEVIKHPGAFAANCMAIRNSENMRNYMNISNNIVSHDFFIAAMASYYGTVDFLYESLLLYRVHSKNLSGNYSSQFSKGIIEAFKRNCRKAMRVKRSAKFDRDIVANELKRKYYIDDSVLRNLVIKKKVRSCLVCAIKMTYKDYKKGNIGIWYK